MDESERKVEERSVSYNEFAKETFTLNIPCPHCDKTLSISLAKLELKKLENKE